MNTPVDQPMPNAALPQEESLALKATPREKASTAVWNAIVGSPTANLTDARRNKKKCNSEPQPIRPETQLT